jgi:hypothetical protein
MLPQVLDVILVLEWISCSWHDYVSGGECVSVVSARHWKVCPRIISSTLPDMYLNSLLVRYNGRMLLYVRLLSLFTNPLFGVAKYGDISRRTMIEDSKHRQSMKRKGAL